MPKKSDKPREPTQTVSLQVRIKEELRARIEASAKEAGTPMNSEIAERLTDSFRQDEALNDKATRQAMLWLAQDIAEVERLSGKSWTEDLATFNAVSLVLKESLGRHKPKPPNYDEAMEFMQKLNSEFAWRDKTYEILAECGAVVERQPNALAAFANGGPAQPYKEIIRDETQWYHPARPDEQMVESDKAWVRERLDEISEIEAGANGNLERLDEFMAPIKKAEKEGQELFEQYNAGYERRISQLMEKASAA